MAYQMVRPARLYQGDEYADLVGFGGVADPLAVEFKPPPATDYPRWERLQHLSDDYDTTHVSLFAHSEAGASIIAADFDPVPLPEGPPGDMVTFGIMLRLTLLLTQQQLWDGVLTTTPWAFTDGDRDVGIAAHIHSFVPLDKPIIAPTTFTSGFDWYTIERQAAREGFTAAFAPAITNTLPGSDYLVFRFYEFALIFDLEGPGLPPLRQFPRDDRFNSAARLWPTSSQQGSLRRHGYF